MMRSLNWTVCGLLAALVALTSTGCPSTPIVEPDPDPDRDPDRTTQVTSTSDEFAEAVRLWEAGPAHYDDVEDLLEDVVDDEPSFARGWYNLGVVRQALGNREGAIEAYRQSNAADAQFVDGLANIAAMMLEERREAEAQQLLEQVVGVNQFHPGANLNLARLQRAALHDNGYIDQERADAAINRIRLSLAGDAMNVAAYETLAGVYYDLNRYDLAQLVCTNAILLGLESPALYNRLGLILLAQDDVTGAYAQFRQAATMDPSFIEASMNLGAVALNYRDYDGALVAFEQVLSNDSEHIDAMVSRAVALRGMDDLAAAEQGYQQVLERDPNNLDTLYNLGVLHQEYHLDYEAALEWFERYLRADTTGISDRYEDVRQRIDLLRELIELLQSDPGYGSEPEVAPVESGEPVDDGTDGADPL